VGNKDRHLRNFNVRVNTDGTFNSLVPLFDTEDSLFSTSLTPLAIWLSSKRDENYLKARPYAKTHAEQLVLLRSFGVEPTQYLRAASHEDIQKIITSHFSGLRGKNLVEFVVNNTKRLNLLKG
jgi:hypothetical protein